MPTPQPPLSSPTPAHGPMPPLARPVSPLVRHRTWAVEQGLLTPEGAAAGYVVLKPCQLTTALWPHFYTLNRWGGRLEAKTVRRLDSEEFATAAIALVRQVRAVQATLRQLARQTAHLVQGRLDQAAPPPAPAPGGLPPAEDLVPEDALTPDGALLLAEEALLAAEEDGHAPAPESA